MNTVYYGVDVSKATLDIACDGKAVEIANDKSAIRTMVKKMPAGSYVAMEATNTYHMQMADICHSYGMHVFVVNPRLTRRYREANGLRGHNDKMDARTLARYIEKEHDGVREYVPKSAEQRTLEMWISRRCKLVGVRTKLNESLKAVPEIAEQLEELMKRIDVLIEKLESLIDRQLEGSNARTRLETIPGVGRVVSAVLVADLDRCGFGSGDAFVAYYGLDPTPNDSGKRRGIRRLSKQGKRLGRAMLYNSALSAVRTQVWRPIYESCLARGLKKVQALIVVARKIAKLAWSMHKHQTLFDPSRLSRALT